MEIKKPEKRKAKSKTVVVQTAFKAKYVKLRVFDEDPKDLFLIEHFKEKWTANHAKFIAPK